MKSCAAGAQTDGAIEQAMAVNTQSVPLDRSQAAQDQFAVGDDAFSMHFELSWRTADMMPGRGFRTTPMILNNRVRRHRRSHSLADLDLKVLGQILDHVRRRWRTPRSGP